tara:strand:- start:432 stop:650 length:219 start_codon:yes stop_codon:yes gene_type:complete
VSVADNQAAKTADTAHHNDGNRGQHPPSAPSEWIWLDPAWLSVKHDGEIEWNPDPLLSVFVALEMRLDGRHY